MIFRLETSTEKSKYFRFILNLNIFLHLYTELFVSRRIIKFKNNHDRPVLFPLQTHGCAIYTLYLIKEERNPLMGKTTHVPTRANCHTISIEAGFWQKESWQLLLIFRSIFFSGTLTLLSHFWNLFQTTSPYNQLRFELTTNGIFVNECHLFFTLLVHLQLYSSLSYTEFSVKTIKHH